MTKSPCRIFKIFRAAKRNGIGLIHATTFSRITTWVLIYAVLNLTSCTPLNHYYKVTNPENTGAGLFHDFRMQNKTVVVHFDEKMWRFESIKINGDSISGKISKKNLQTKYHTTNPYKSNLYSKTKVIDESWVLQEVHVHITNYTEIDSTQISFPIDAINLIQIYDKDGGAMFGSLLTSWGVIAIGVLVLFFIYIFLVSCPFIYVFDGEEYIFQGEIYSGSIYPQLERHDYMKLPVFKNENKEYSIKITNEAREIQHTNLCELMVFDHPEGMEVLIDKNGMAHTITSLTMPSKATSLFDYEVGDLISSKDDYCYLGQNAPRGNLTDGVILEFPRHQDAETAKVVVRAKNTYFLDFMMGMSRDLFGDAYGTWKKMQRKAPAERLQQWSLNQNMPLSLYVEENGEWKFFDYYHMVGPVALKEDVLVIPLDKNDDKPLRLKIESGANFWEIDYVVVDFTENIPIKSHRVPLKSAITSKQKNIKDKLFTDDKKYYVQPKVGDEAVLTFDLPAQTQPHRSIILHSKGHYEILRDATGKPNISYLKSLREPGQFNRYCNEFIEFVLSNSSSQ